MIRLGITGGIGSGKSIISTLLKVYGIPVYISDIESKILTESSPIIKEKLIHAFGKELYEGGQLNKALFASYIFNDKNKLTLANSIIHPEVNKHYNEWCEIQSAHHNLIALESAILYESNIVQFTDKVLVVYAPLEDRIEKTMRRDNSTREKVLERINNQESDEEKIKKADFVIYNDEKLSLIKQIEFLLQSLNK